MNVLIVKLSSLGDVVYAMPAVQDMLSELPGTLVDWVVEPDFAPLVRRCAGVHRVIECDLRRWRETVFTADTRTAWRAFSSDLQYECYDAVLDLQGLSKSALVAKMARLSPQGLRYALANQTEGRSFEAPTRWEADVAIPVEPRIHAIERSRVMCARALVYALPEKLSFGLAPHVGKELRAIKNIANTFFDSGSVAPASIVALLHGSSRADKHWPDEYWLELGHRLNALGYTVAFPHGSDEEQWRSESIASRLEQAVVWPRMGMNALTDALGECLGAVGVDSGLCNIATALDLPLVRLYNFDTVWRTGPRDNDHQFSVFGEPTPSVDAVWNAWMQASALASLRDSMR
ncbi:heptosyltransferase-1 [Rhodoferax sp. OV413]|uniref:lipopolysaccharide heptosyltransferase I n=1 Tax=Rhodoferax sp. OV413 TaxID=1855285 RepID=UPI00088705A1|nr:lipopolysaccharide heptosyltransferase I [Rhodoferax sp. OV413]SDP78365.1 heptosyltransferase-1 [Rhodoferax sp. OV413]